MSFFEWLGRVIMLVLAGMITLSIIGAIASIPSGSLPDRIGVTEPSAPPPANPVPAPAPESPPEPVGQDASDTRPRAEPVSVATAKRDTVDPSEWLEAITYALLALVGVAVLGTVILWRNLHERRRIADALEALSRFGPASMPSPPRRA